MVHMIFGEDVVEKLREPLDPASVSARKGGGDKMLSYLSGHYVDSELLRVFGYGGFATRVMSGPTEVRPGLFQSTVELTLFDSQGERATSYQDVGYGTHTIPVKEAYTIKDLQEMEKAGKESVTDAKKRCAVSLGDRFGLVLYAKGDPIHDEAAALRGNGPAPSAGPRPRPTPKASTGMAQVGERKFTLPIPEPNDGDGYKCEDCQRAITEGGSGGWTAGQKAAFGVKATGRIVCAACSAKAKEA